MCEDTPEEVAAMGAIPASSPELTDEMSSDVREATVLDYARSMPGATQVVLEAGDVAFYCAASWHIGHYTPINLHATLHENFAVPTGHIWREAVPRMRTAMVHKVSC